MKLEPILPLVWLIIIAGIAAGFHLLSVPAEMTALIVGAGLTRIKVTRTGNHNTK